MFGFKKFTTLAIAGALAFGMAACAPGETIDDDGEAPTEVESVDPAEFEGKAINYLYFTDGPDEQATRDNIAAFEEEYGASVELEILPYSDLVSQLNARLSGGNAPDVVRLTGLGEFRADLLPLDPYVGEGFAEEFLEGPIAATKNDEGQVIAVPSDLTLNGMFVNVDLFDEAGVELPDPSDPWSWEEMIEAGRQVQTATGSSYAFAMDKSGHRVATILSQHGTAMLDNDGFALDKDKAAEALQPLLDMMADDSMPRDFWIGSGSRYEGANEIFLAGETPLYMSGTWQVGQFAADAPFTWAAAPNPCADECGGFPGGKFMAALSASDEPALAAEFVRFMNDTERQEHFASVSGNLPTRADLADQGVTYDPAAQEAMDVFIEDLARTPAFGYEANGNPAFGPSATVLVEQISEVVVGNKDLPTALDDIETEVEGIVEEMGSW